MSDEFERRLRYILVPLTVGSVMYGSNDRRGDKRQDNDWASISSMRAIAWLLFLASTTLVAASCSESRESNLVVDPSALDLGQLRHMDAFSVKVPLTNIGADPIDIRAFKPSCGCVKIIPESLVIQPGARSFVHLTLNLGGIADAATNDTLIPISIRVLPQSVDGNLPAFTLRGALLRPMRFIPRQIEFGECSEQLGPSETTIMISALAPVDHIEATSPRHLGARVEKDIQNNSYKMRVAFNPPPCEKVIDFTEKISVICNLKDGRQVLAAVPVHAVLMTDLEVSPDPVLFGRVGMRATVGLSVSSRSGEDWIFQDATTTGGAQLECQASSRLGSSLKIHCALLFNEKAHGGSIADGTFKLNFISKSGKKAICQVPWVAAPH